MSLDFAVTQFYRVLLDDILLLYDAYRIYAKNRKYQDRSFKEFSEALVDLTETEAQNFEDIDVKKLTKDQEESVRTIVWDYLHSVIIRYLLDDASQYPFWSCKLRVFSQERGYGMSIVRAYHKSMVQALSSKGFGLRTLYEGFGPYMAASLVVNIKYLVKVTNQFIFSILAKIPSPPSLEDVHAHGEDHVASHLNKLKKHQSQSEEHAKGVIPGIHGIVSSRGSGKKERKKKTNRWERSALNLATTFLSHPALVVATHMVCNPLCQGSPWMVAYIKVLTDYGVRSFYRGLKSRTLVNILPYSSFIVMALVDNFVYDHIMQEIDVHTHLTPLTSPPAAAPTSLVASSTSPLTAAIPSTTSVLRYLNYGLLTLAHAVPGFLCFLGVRGLGRIVFGESVHRRHQRLRRKEIVEAYLTKMNRRQEQK